MRRPVVLGTSPFIHDVYNKDASQLFADSGGNSGNLAFLYATVSHLAGHVPILPWGASPKEVRAAGDIVVIPLANQLGHHTDLHDAARWLRAFNMPIVGIGLGAQASAMSMEIELTPGTADWLDTLARLSPSDAPNVGVRGAYTKSQIERLGYRSTAAVTGCPSNFINVTNPADRIAEGFRRKPNYIAVNAGIPFIPALAQIERDLADIVTESGGAYIVQHGLEMLRLARKEFALIDPAELELCRNYIRPHSTRAQFETWCVHHATAFYDARFWMDYVKRFDFVIGTRFHGAMLALQAGVPAACITHDSRTEEMCETMGVPHCNYRDIGTLTKDNMMDYFRFDPAAYTAKRRALQANYVKLYEDADIEISDGLKKLIRLSH